MSKENQLPRPIQPPHSSHPPRPPLYGLRVVDATDIKGALCGRLLGDLGADVLKVENSLDESIFGEDSPEHKFRNANKRSLITKNGRLDIAKKSHRKELFEILQAADVFIENLGPQLMKEYGFQDLTDHDKNLMHISVSDFGLSGPRSSWRLEPLTAFSASGAHFASGFPDLPPCWMPGFLAHDCASVFGAIGAVAGIMDRRKTQTGQMVEVSVQEAALHGLNPWSIAMKDYLTINPFLPYKGKRNADASYWVMKAKDGWVRMVLSSPAHWQGFLSIIRNPESLMAPEWADFRFRLMNLDVARMLCQDLMTDRTRQELMEESLAVDTMIGPVQTIQEFIDHPQTKLRNFFQELDGEKNIAFAPWKLKKSPASLRLPAPKKSKEKSASEKNTLWLDEDDMNFCPNNGLKIGGFGRSPANQSDASQPGALLSGVRVIEFGAAAVVPEMCWVLSELGAEVIKVESREYPDVLRRLGVDENLNVSFAYNTECRGRKSAAINTSTEKGSALAFQLCATADIVAENFRGGALDKRGLSYDDLSAVNPGLIYVSSQGYGKGGPMGEVPAFGPVNSAFAGTHLMWNHSDEKIKDRYPCGTSLNHPDHIAGKLLSIAVLAALDHRARTGEGQFIEMAQTEASAYLMGEAYMKGSCTPNGNESFQVVPHNVYPALEEKVEGKDDESNETIERWVSIVAATEKEFQNLAAVLGMKTVPKEWQSRESRLDHRDEIDAWISNWTKTRSPDEIMEALQSNGVSAMLVQGPEDHHIDAHLQERGAIIKLNHAEVGDERHIGSPLKMSKTQLRIAESSPCLGVDTEEVLAEVLGLSESEITQLKDDKVCW